MGFSQLESNTIAEIKHVTKETLDLENVYKEGRTQCSSV